MGLVQLGPWTVVALANHVWSFAGADDRTDIDRTFVQPFVAHTTETASTFSIQSESAFDRTASDWSVPVTVAASKMLLVGGLPVSLQAGVGYRAKAPDSGPAGVRARLRVTLLR
jgi:hypothetical protein